RRLERADGGDRGAHHSRSRSRSTTSAILTLVKKDGMPEVAIDLYRALKPHMACQYDEKGSVGRRYARQDEAGTPWCLTIDGQTLADRTVTLRDRDSLVQERVKIAEVVDLLRDRL
ncbi:MAG: His/Gly/Thr/Pro-type tRNA ligase C-terminal domain-containing protein, partial [Planctomycetota bacterium]